jgi:hypothetical protein
VEVGGLALGLGATIVMLISREMRVESKKRRFLHVYKKIC